jgi:hypothetical protein
MENFENPEEWVILFSLSLNHYVKCTCGHRVKRITYIYHKPSKTIQYIGKTCVKKYQIYLSMTNTLLLDVIKNIYTSTKEWDIVTPIRDHIHKLYLGFTEHITSGNLDYVAVVLPFRRLLSDVCDLVSEYGFDLVDLLKDIERDVESLNYTTRHQMIDEYESVCDSIDTISDIESDSEISSVLDYELCQRKMERVYEEHNTPDIYETPDIDELSNTNEPSDIDELSKMYEKMDINESLDMDETQIVYELSNIYKTPYIKNINESSKVWNVISYSGIYILQRTTSPQLEEPVSQVVPVGPVVPIEPKKLCSCCMIENNCWCEIKYRLKRIRIGVNEFKEDKKVHKERIETLNSNMRNLLSSINRTL